MQFRRSERLRLKDEKRSQKTIPKIGSRWLLTSSDLDYEQETTPQILHPCKYEYRGCKRKFASNALQVHVKQCRFRWFECEGKVFANWACTWKGYYEDIARHFKDVHRVRTYMMAETMLNIHIALDEDADDLQLVQKQRRLFWFKHQLLTRDKTAYWLCQYVGPQDEAATFCYEFMIKDGARKFAVTELCHTDAVDAKQIYESGKCVVMTFDQIKSFMREPGKVNINFKIKKKLTRRRH